MTYSKTFRKCLALAVLLMPLGLYAQQPDTADLPKPSVAELLKLPVEAYQEQSFLSSSVKASTVRETPGIVTVITKEDIRLSGAREITDLLRQVPGFEVAKSDDNVISVGVRGLWSDDGKVLFEIDGMMLNDLSYGAVPLIHRIPLDNIERIEIVRGPGSALYGGFASLAVVRIFTQNAEADGFARANLRYGLENGYQAHATAQVTAMHKLDNGAQMQVSGLWNNGLMSARPANFANGTVYNYADSSTVNSKHFNAGFMHKGLKINFMTEEIDNIVPAYNYTWYIKSTNFRASKQIKVSDKLTLEPILAWKQQHPWSYFNDTSTVDEEYNTLDRRISGNVIGLYQASERLAVAFGAGYFHDKSRFIYPGQVFSTEEEMVKYFNLSAFSEVSYTAKWGNVTAGFRTDDHSAVTPAIVPRFAYTRAWERAHVKLLYSHAFRMPAMQNINLAPVEMKPERVRVLEIEGGYRKAGLFSATLNVYATDIKDPIVYLYNAADESYTYENRGRSGSRGVEGNLLFTRKWGHVSMMYATYVAHKNTIEEFALEDSETELLGMPRHKAAVQAVFKFNNMWSLAGNALWSARRYTYHTFDFDYEDVRLVEYKPYWLTSLFVNATGLKNGRFDISLGVHNLLNQDIYFIAPTNSGDFALPDHGRELYLSVRANL